MSSRTDATGTSNLSLPGVVGRGVGVLDSRLGIMSDISFGGVSSLVVVADV